MLCTCIFLLTDFIKINCAAFCFHAVSCTTCILFCFVSVLGLSVKNLNLTVELQDTASEHASGKSHRYKVLEVIVVGVSRV